MWYILWQGNEFQIFVEKLLQILNYVFIIRLTLSSLYCKLI